MGFILRALGSPERFCATEGHDQIWDLESCLNGTVKVKLEGKGGSQEASVEAKPVWVSVRSGATWAKGQMRPGLSEGRGWRAWERGWGRGAWELLRLGPGLGGGCSGMTSEGPDVGKEKLLEGSDMEGSEGTLVGFLARVQRV